MGESQHHQQALGYTNFSPTADPVLMHSFQPSQELYSLQAGMEMLGVPSKPQQNTDAWRAFFPVAGSSSNAASSFPQTLNENLMVTPERVGVSQWHPRNRMLVDESSARFLFPSCQGNGQSSSGLSLSLNHAETSNSSYDQPPFDHHGLTSSRDTQLLQKPADHHLQDGRFFQSSTSQSALINPYQQSQQPLKSTKYLIPARELLNEFCSLETAVIGSSKDKASKTKPWEEGGTSSSSISFNQSLYSLDIHELQGRKAKLLSMLEEVDKRYRRYREQMRAVVLSFEAVAGEGAATVYSALAAKVMSRHFRCLRDGIVGQIDAIKKAMGEKDAVAPGTSRGETPRLKLIDQCIRQQRAFQQAGMMESHPWRPQRGLPERSVSILRAWLFEHFLHPYPSDVDKHILARQTGLSRSQVSNWFINARVRLWKPMVEEMYLEETKEQENQTSQEENYNSSDNVNRNLIYNSCQVDNVEDRKPAPGQLLTEPDSLSWVISNSDGRERAGSKSSQNPNASDNFGVVDLDFTSYNQCSHPSFGSGVSLTLGLQQHNGGGMGLSFSPPAPQPSLLFSREQMEECHPSQLPIVDADAQNSAYRNLVGAQLLRHFAG
ncbi:unnamed protein product [Musa acuminata var. zebrina]